MTTHVGSDNGETVSSGRLETRDADVGGEFLKRSSLDGGPERTRISDLLGVNEAL